MRPGLLGNRCVTASRPQGRVLFPGTEARGRGKVGVARPNRRWARVGRCLASACTALALLQILGAIAVKYATIQPKEIAYHGKRFRVEAACSLGFHESPFQDGTWADCDATVEDLAFSLLVPEMVERYGFYE
jgi:hypothetical protein